MAKNDLAKGIRVPRRSEGDEIHGSMIMQGTIPPMALAVDYLSAIASNLGRATAGSLWIGGPNRSFLHIGEEYEGGKPILLFEMASEGGVRFVTARTGDNRAFTLGERLADGSYPIQFTVTQNPETGTFTTIDPQVLICNAVAKTFLLAGQIDLVTGSGGYDDAGATGIRLQAGWGIQSKQAGTVSAFWDAATGQFNAGDQTYPTTLDKLGLSTYVQDWTGRGLVFRHKVGADAYEIGQVMAYLSTDLSGTAIVALQAGQNAHPSLHASRLYVGAFSPSDLSSYAQFEFRARPRIDGGSLVEGLVDKFTLARPPLSLPTEDYLMELDGYLLAEGLFSDRIEGGLNLQATRHAITNVARAELPVGALSVMNDDSGNPWLCVNTAGSQYYKVALTLV